VVFNTIKDKYKNPKCVLNWKNSRSIRIKDAPIIGFLSLASACVLIFSASPAWGYRPFVSTNAVVEDPREIEVELGYFKLERNERKTTFDIPQVELDYGIVNNLEVEAEFEVAEIADEDDIQLLDPELSLKAVLKEGFLQEKKGLSIAVKTSLLLPSTIQEERKFGFEEVGILSGKLSLLTLHLNLGGGINREGNLFTTWGLIWELPIIPKLRLVGEVNGEKAKEESFDNSALVGFIWQPLWPDVFFDLGIRKGISGEAADWEFTTGITFSFSLGSHTNDTSINRDLRFSKKR
jgi:hypothetical protein